MLVPPKEDIFSGHLLSPVVQSITLEYNKRTPILKPCLFYVPKT